MADGMVVWREWREWHMEWWNGGMAYGMVEWRNGGMVEWREWLLEWREWLPTYYFMVHANACVGIVLKREPILKKSTTMAESNARSNGMAIVINSCAPPGISL